MTFDQALQTRDIGTIARFIRNHRRFQRAFMGAAIANRSARSNIECARAYLGGR